MKEIKISEGYINFVETFYNISKDNATGNESERMYLKGYLDALAGLGIRATVNEDGTLKIDR